MSDTILPIQRVSRNVDVTPESAQITTFENALTGIETPTENQPVLEVTSDVKPTVFDKTIGTLSELQNQQNNLLIESKALQSKTDFAHKLELNETTREYDGRQGDHTRVDQKSVSSTHETNTPATGAGYDLGAIEEKHTLAIKQVKHLLIISTVFAPLKAGADTIKQFLRM